MTKYKNSRRIHLMQKPQNFSNFPVTSFKLINTFTPNQFNAEAIKVFQFSNNIFQSVQSTRRLHTYCKSFIRFCQFFIFFRRVHKVGLCHYQKCKHFKVMSAQIYVCHVIASTIIDTLYNVKIFHVYLNFIYFHSIGSKQVPIKNNLLLLLGSTFDDIYS